MGLGEYLNYRFVMLTRGGIKGDGGMHEIAGQMLSRLQEALPGATVYWEKEPASGGFKGSVLTAEWKHRQFTMQFDSNSEESAGETLDVSLVEQVVDDFVEFFTNSIYPKEKFTRIISEPE